MFSKFQRPGKKLHIFLVSEILVDCENENGFTECYKGGCSPCKNVGHV